MADPLYYQCGMCGVWFLMRASLERHRSAELPFFISESAAKNQAYEEHRRQYRIDHPGVSRERVAELEAGRA